MSGRSQPTNARAYCDVTHMNESCLTGPKRLTVEIIPSLGYVADRALELELVSDIHVFSSVRCSELKCIQFCCNVLSALQCVADRALELELVSDIHVCCTSCGSELKCIQVCCNVGFSVWILGFWDRV